MYALSIQTTSPHPQLTRYRPQVVGTMHRIAELQKTLSALGTFDPSDNPWFKCLDRDLPRPIKQEDENDGDDSESSHLTPSKSQKVRRKSVSLKKKEQKKQEGNEHSGVRQTHCLVWNQQSL